MLVNLSGVSTGRAELMAKGRIVSTETPVAMKSVTVSFRSLSIEPHGGE